jgi:hypothetical protein
VTPLLVGSLVVMALLLAFGLDAVITDVLDLRLEGGLLF